MKISVSYLKSPYNKEETIKMIENTSADYLHVDLKDGLFVDENNFTWEEMWPLLNKVKKPLDIHLMTLDVEHHIKNARVLNPEYITFQFEAAKYVKDCIDLVKSSGIKCGIAISPETLVEEIEPYLKKIDLVLVLGVHPGKGGQKFIKETVEKLIELKSLKKDYNFSIEVDGGINEKTVSLVSDTADIIVSGSYICESENFEKSIQILKSKA
ncbi:MAG: ribulose-phosphate 3-epimerase [Bacilli bacterium]|nr:ribulose-phosphate 3-epimerase [Bacilli bacterium]